MKNLALVLALLPTLASAAPQSPPARGAGQAGDDAARAAQMQKRMRIARTLGLAEALDLDEAGALKLRETLAKSDEKRAPLQQQVQESVRVLRAAARGNGAAAGHVDAALQRLGEARQKLVQLDAELLAQLTQGATPARKARAALFLEQQGERSRNEGGAGPGGGPPRAPGSPPAGGYGARPPPYYRQPAYTPPGVTPPGAPPDYEPPAPPGNPSNPGPPAPGAGPADGPEAEDWFSDP